jgi:multidrug resistance efflux pump
MITTWLLTNYQDGNPSLISLQISGLVIEVPITKQLLARLPKKHYHVITAQITNLVMPIVIAEIHIGNEIQHSDANITIFSDQYDKR